ncbi:MAG: hypothetical protein IPL23_08430 [Saprospiraceae bacterium]|nr:hypothetical protein [Saprospiraceae bacterium]
MGIFFLLCCEYKTFELDGEIQCAAHAIHCIRSEQCLRRILREQCLRRNSLRSQTQLPITVADHCPSLAQPIANCGRRPLPIAGAANCQLLAQPIAHCGRRPLPVAGAAN